MWSSGAEVQAGIGIDLSTLTGITSTTNELTAPPLGAGARRTSTSAGLPVGSLLGCRQLVCGLLLSLTAIGGCSGQQTATAPATDGPLVAGEGTTHWCLPVASGTTFTFGHDVFRSSASEPMSVLGVELADAEGIEVEQAVFVPLLGTNSIGQYEAYPPTEADLRSLDLTDSWANRHVVGTDPVLLDPAFPQELVLGLRTTAARGTASGITVTYRAGDDDFAVTTRTSLELLSGQQCP